MNSMILTTPSKIGASVKLQFIICIWTLKNQIWKNEFCCVHWPCDTMLTFPLKIQSFEKKGRDTNFLLAIFGIFSHKNCSSWKLSLVSKLFQFLGKIRWKRICYVGMHWCAFLVYYPFIFWSDFGCSQQPQCVFFCGKRLQRCLLCHTMHT